MARQNLRDAGYSISADDNSFAPVHVAIIMDGNRRWAEQNGLPVFEGHRRGVDAVRQAVQSAEQLGVKFLSLYSFSTENWTRPEGEVIHLMNLLRLFIRSDLNKLHKKNVRVRIIGSRDKLDSDLNELLDYAEEKTSKNQGLTLIVAFNYGARQEIACAAQRLARKAVAGDLRPDEITPDLFNENLDTAGMPDPDLVIRTSGEQRLSNFLLWQLAYAELIFLPILWPEFQHNDFVAAIEEFNLRERRYGGRQAAV